MTENQIRADEELSRYREAKKDIMLLHRKIQVTEARCNKITRTSADIMQDSGRKDEKGHPIYVCVDVQENSQFRREDLIDSLMDLKAHYWKEQIDAEQLCRELEISISDACSGVYARILSMFYLYNQNLERIAVSENFSFDWVKRLRWRALEQYGETLPRSTP